MLHGHYVSFMRHRSPQLLNICRWLRYALGIATLSSSAASIDACGLDPRLFLLLLAASALWLILNPLARWPWPQSFLPFMMECLFLANYVLKASLMTLYPEDLIYHVWLTSILENLHAEDLQGCIVTCFLALFAFYASLWCCWFWTKSRPSAPWGWNPRGRPSATQPVLPAHVLRVLQKRVPTILWFAIITELLLDASAWYFDLAPGDTQVGRLPFRLEGVLHYLRNAAPHMLIGACLISGVWTRRRSLITVALLLAATHCLADFFLYTSKAAFILMILYMAVVIALARIELSAVLSRRGQITVLILALAVFPLASRMRIARGTHGLSTMDAFFSAVTDFHGFDEEMDVAISLLSRLPGADCVLLARHNGRGPLLGELMEALAEHGFLSTYFTREVAEIPPTNPTAVAPGLAGFFHVMAGDLGVFVGCFAFSAVMILAWMWILRRKTLWTPVYLGVYSSVMYGAAMEGTLDYTFGKQVPLCVVVCVLFWFFLDQRILNPRQTQLVVRNGRPASRSNRPAVMERTQGTRRPVVARVVFTSPAPHANITTPSCPEPATGNQ